MLKYLVSAILIFASVSVEAALGDRVESVEKDRAQLKAARKATVKTMSSYTVQELTLVGTTVREFVTTDGVVFAVSWRGIARPDLSQLLGSYYNVYKSARKAAPRAGRQSVVRSNSLVVRHGGHMRDLRGQAVLMNLLPQGTSAEELQ